MTNVPIRQIPNVVLNTRGPANIFCDPALDQGQKHDGISVCPSFGDGFLT